VFGKTCDRIDIRSLLKVLSIDGLSFSKISLEENPHIEPVHILADNAACLVTNEANIPLWERTGWIDTVE
jgi:hypothetical protein